MQERSSRRTFVSTNAGYRLEVHPPRPWIEELVGSARRADARRAPSPLDNPDAKAAVLAELLDTDRDGTNVYVGDSIVRFFPGGPQGRPQLQAELLF